TLQKHAGNPVIPDLPAGYNIDEYRDHCVWREGDTWQQLIGARIKDIGGSVLLYRSQDLIDWQFIQPILVGGQYAVDPLPKNAMWECPDLFALGDQHMLVLSILADGPQHSGYFLGRYADGKFTPHRYRRMDYGDWEYYAPQSFINEAGERIHFGWMQEARSIAWQLEAGWSGLLSLPRTIDLDPAGRVSIQPHRVVAQLRGESYFWDRRELLDGQMYTAGIQGRALELQAVFSMDAPAREVGLRLFCSPAGDEYTEIVYDREKGALSLRRSHASLDSRANRDDRGGELELEPGEDLELRIFIDHSVIEVFANGRAALTGRVYPVRKDSTGIQVFSKGGNGSLAGLNAWRMLPVW
ncbi:MAG: glycoside hydrolase family 32 protein, partial [Anaerolineaceae bacterium]